MSNHSYVFIPTDKLVEIIRTTCPPMTSTLHSDCLSHEDGFDEDCLKCWKDWLKDGE